MKNSLLDCEIKSSNRSSSTHTINSLYDPITSAHPNHSFRSSQKDSKNEGFKIYSRPSRSRYSKDFDRESYGEEYDYGINSFNSSNLDSSSSQMQPNHASYIGFGQNNMSVKSAQVPIKTRNRLQRLSLQPEALRIFRDLLDLFESRTWFFEITLSRFLSVFFFTFFEIFQGISRGFWRYSRKISHPKKFTKLSANYPQII